MRWKEGQLLLRLIHDDVFGDAYLRARSVGKTSVCVFLYTEKRVHDIAVESSSRVLSRLVAHEPVDEGVRSRLDEHTSEGSYTVSAVNVCTRRNN